MGCGASVEDVVQPTEPEDPMDALRRQIQEERSTLKDMEGPHEDAEGECRYNMTAVRKLDRVITMMANDIEDAQALYDDLKHHIALQDALDIREASKGFGTDEAKMGKVVVGRLPETLILTNEIYQQKYNRTLESQIRGENKTLLGLLTGGLTNFGKFLVYRCMPPAKRDALLLKKAMSGFGCSDYILVEILSTRTNQELKDAAAVYAEDYDGEDMVERIKSETGGFGKKWYGLWIDTLVEFDRMEEPGVHCDPAAVADELYSAGEGKWMGCDEQPFIDHLCKANEETCQAIAAAYEEHEDSNKTIAEAVADKMGGDLEYSVLARVYTKPEFYARRIYKACKGWGTDEECIGRVISCMTKKEAEEFEAAYNRFYAEEDAPYNNLRDLLKSELSGSFLDAIYLMLDDHPPKGHRMHESEYPRQAELAGNYFKDQVSKAYAPPTASELGKGPLEGPAMCAGISEMFICAGYDIDQAPSSQPFAHPDRGALFEGMPDNVDDAKALIAELQAAQGEVQARTKGAKLNVDLFMPQVVNKANEMKYKDHYLNQITNDNTNMLEFCASRDADLVKEATEGWGTDEDKLIRVLCSLPKEQLRRVDEIYKERYGTSLREVTDSELGGMFEGDFKYFMKCVLTLPAELDAELLTESMKGWGTNDTLLCELCCTRSNAEIKEAKKTFEDKEGKPLEQWVDGDTSGSYQSLLLECLKANRDESLDVDKDLAAQQAANLQDAGFGGGDVNADVITGIVANASRVQMKAIEEAYENQFGKPMVDAIKESMGGDWEKALFARCLDKETYYATALQGAFKGWGTDEKAVSRILGRNNKGAVKRIGVRFEEMYSQSLHDAIESEVSGNFKKALLTMLFAEAPGQDADPAGGELDIGGVMVPKDTARLFIKALKDEYTQDPPVEGAVGQFYADLVVEGEIQDAIAPEEDTVKNADDKAAAVEEIIVKWGMA